MHHINRGDDISSLRLFVPPHLHKWPFVKSCHSLSFMPFSICLQQILTKKLLKTSLFAHNSVIWHRLWMRSYYSTSQLDPVLLLSVLLVCLLQHYFLYWFNECSSCMHSQSRTMLVDGNVGCRETLDHVQRLTDSNKTVSKYFDEMAVIYVIQICTWDEVVCAEWQWHLQMSVHACVPAYVLNSGTHGFPCSPICILSECYVLEWVASLLPSIITNHWLTLAFK